VAATDAWLGDLDAWITREPEGEEAAEYEPEPLDDEALEAAAVRSAERAAAAGYLADLESRERAEWRAREQADALSLDVPF
jgi:hypothetical protein